MHYGQRFSNSRVRSLRGARYDAGRGACDPRKKVYLKKFDSNDPIYSDRESRNVFFFIREICNN